MTRADWMAVEREFNRRKAAKADREKQAALRVKIRPLWSRWGRGNCEGYSMELDNGQLRFGIRNLMERTSPGSQWELSLNADTLGYFATFEEATARGQEVALMKLDPTSEDWAKVKTAPPAKRRIRAGRRR